MRSHFWLCTKSENSICGGSVTISIQILTSSNWTPLSCSGWYQRFTSSLWAEDCIAGFPVRQNLTLTTTTSQAHAAFSEKWSLLLIILCKAHANTKVCIIQAMISLEGINGSFYLPPESLTFLRCLEFFKNKMLRHSAQLNIPNGLYCLTKFVTRYLFLLQNPPKVR